MGPKQALVRLWLAFSTVGTIISLASLFDDVVAWGPFIRAMIAAYRRIIDPVWSFLLGWLPFHMPPWTHDYFTLTALMSIALFWALHQTRVVLQTGPSTPLLAVWATELEFKVGGNSFDLIGKSATRAAEARGDVSHALRAAIADLARPETSWRLVADGVIAAALLLLAFPILPVVVPSFMAWRDRVANRRARVAFAQRRRRVEESGLETSDKQLLVAAIDSRAADYASVEALNEIYHAEIRRQIVYYYLAVAVSFGGLVLANYVLTRVMEPAKALDQSSAIPEPG